MNVAVIGGTGTIGKELVKKLSDRHQVLNCTGAGLAV